MDALGISGLMWIASVFFYLEGCFYYPANQRIGFIFKFSCQAVQRARDERVYHDSFDDDVPFSIFDVHRNEQKK